LFGGVLPVEIFQVMFRALRARIVASSVAPNP
jgi:hypothetical protein